MKYAKLIAIIAICLMATGIFITTPVKSVQPPLDTSTYYVGTIGQAQRLDPARAYDTASGEMIQNVYQTLIWYADKHPVTFVPGTGYNLQVSDYADLTKFKGVLATEVPTIANGRIVINATGSYWTFTANTSAIWQPWVKADGSIAPQRFLTADDIVYTFRRELVVEMSSSPSWMFFLPAFGTMGFRYGSGAAGITLSAFSNGTFVNAANETWVANAISDFCYPSGGDNVTFHFQNAWAPNVMYQIFSQTWGSVVNKYFCIEHGDWDGLFTAGWSNNYRRKPNIRASALDMYKDPAVYGAAGSKYTNTGMFPTNDVPTMSGTGPYNFTATNWDQATKTWRCDKFDNYWLGWAGNHVSTVIEKGVDSWPTRKMLFLEGEFDVVVVPRANMYDLLASPSDPYTPLPGINLVYNVATLSNDVLLFNANVSEASAYQSYVGPPGGHTTTQVATFFADTYIRQAFAWAFNYTSYVHDAWFDEAIIQRSWWVDGLSPADFKNENASMPLRNYDLSQMWNSLTQAALVNGRNVSQDGFDVTLVYNVGNDQRLIACNLIAAAFTALGAAHGGTNKFRVTVLAQDWPVFLSAEQNGQLPMYDVGWLADFADPDNFARPYQHSQGDFVVSQGPPFPPDQTLVDTEIDAAIIEPNVATRKALYQDLQYRYWLDALSFPLIQPVGRRFARDWVQGWYYNALFPGLYAYDIYKSTVALSNVDVDMTGTVTPATPSPAVGYINSTGFLVNGNGDPNLRNNTYTLHVVYKVGGAIATLRIAVGLSFTETTVAGGKEFPDATYVSLAPGTDTSVIEYLTVDPTTGVVMSADITGIGHNLAGEAYPFANNANDTNLVNNVQGAGTLTAKSGLVGDTNQDGIVDIYDAIVLAGVFGIYSDNVRWNPAADLNGDLTVDIYDAILLAGHFNQHIP